MPTSVPDLPLFPNVSEIESLPLRSLAARLSDAAFDLLRAGLHAEGIAELDLASASDADRVLLGAALDAVAARVEFIRLYVMADA